MNSGADTPMFRQYLDLKAQVPDALLFYRMGDFYELFFEDARVAAEALELTLTSRNKNDPEPIPMCGVPHHAADGYLKRLVEAGFKVAIAEQGAEIQSKGKVLMSRQLTRVVSAGLPYNTQELDAREGCFLAAVGASAPLGPFGLAFLDVSTGDLRVTEVDSLDAVVAELQRLEAREVVIEAAWADPLRSLLGARWPQTVAEAAWFDPAAGHRLLCERLGVHDLGAFAIDAQSPACGAAGAALTYAGQTGRVDTKNVLALRRYEAAGSMAMDEATRRNLELLRPLRGSGRVGTVLGFLDRTTTAMGARLLRDWLLSPLLDVAAIRERHDAVDAMMRGPLRAGVRDALQRVADIERLATRASQGTANARDLVSLADSLRALPALTLALAKEPSLVERLPEDQAPDLAEAIEARLVPEPPIALTEGGLIREGFSSELDTLRRLASDGRGAIARIEQRERERTGISSLKIKHNHVFGYFLEVTAANLQRVPADWMRKQTLSNCERFVTPELKEFEDKVLGADDKRKALELELFRALREQVGLAIARLQGIARAVAWLDVIASFAWVAREQRLVRPIVDTSLGLELTACRHPVVEQAAPEERFVPNDLTLEGEARLVILTGPNMAGKSTLMRQVALAALLAQVGSFVAADSARLGVCDRIFVRVGASDDLARGRSTFMVEMSETALILRQATARSLVLLDEIGRGTSTYDGLAIAWAVAEAVRDALRCRAIFATHYHELTVLADEAPGVRNLHVAVSEWGDRIVFLRTLREGGASKSYGIQCARLAGMPEGVIDRSRQILGELEKRPRHHGVSSQLSLFGETLEAVGDVPPVQVDPVREAVRSMRPDELSPKDALDALYRLHDLALADG